MNLYIYYPKDLFFTINVACLTIQVAEIRLNAINQAIADQCFHLIMLDMPDVTPTMQVSSITRRIEEFRHQPLFPGQAEGLYQVPDTRKPRKQRNPTNPPPNQS
jgi:hypothetical protein